MNSGVGAKASAEHPAVAKLRDTTAATSLHSGIGGGLLSAYQMCSSTLLNGGMTMCIQSTSAASLDRLSTDVSVDSSKVMVEKQLEKTPSGFGSLIKNFLLAAFLSVFVLEFSLWFPFNIPGVASAAVKTYIPAWYHYDEEDTLFDNTAWTYDTDYLLTAVMSLLAVRILMESAPDNCPKKNGASLRLRLYSASLLICYGISTLAGGWAHQHFTTIDSLNTTRFRVFWYLCVGNVSFASCYMGLIGREVQKVFGVPSAVPLGPWWFWPMYGTYMAAATGLGYISFKRPACDIFIAGITQFPTTFYCLGALGIRKWPSRKNRTDVSPIGLVRLPYRLMYYVGFIGNAPLLPMYPLLVQYTSMSLAGVNTLLHCWLMTTWGMQGISLLHLCKAMSTYKPKASKD